MKKLKVYIDSSVIGAILDVEDTRRLEVTLEFFELLKNQKIEGFISNITIEEIEKAPSEVKNRLVKVIKETKPGILTETEECIVLVESYLKEGIVPLKYRDDARHIAVAVVNELDAIVSWNFRHIVNIRVKRKVNGVNMRYGYKMIDMLSPEEVVYGEMEI